MNAAMGGAVGGGFQGGMASTAVLGAREKADVAAQAREKTRNLQFQWLDKQLELKERDISRKFGKEMSAKDQAHQLELEAVRMGGELPEGMQDAIDNGDHDRAMEIWEQSQGGGGSGSGSSYEGSREGWVSEGSAFNNDNYQGNLSENFNEESTWRHGNGPEIDANNAANRVMRVLQDLGVGFEGTQGMFHENLEENPGQWQWGTNDQTRELQAWFSQMVSESDDGLYPGNEQIEEKLREMGILQ
jgi:hypothetical protein